MRINRIILRHLKMKLIHPFTTSFGTMRDKEFILVEAIDHDGVSGWAESVAFPEPSYNEETLRTNWHMLESFLIPIVQGREIEHPGEITGLLQHIRGNHMAKSALEGAYWDLYAKKQGIPLAAAIGGKKQEIEVGVSIGIKNSPAELLETIASNVAKGYKRIKIKIKPGWDVDIVAEVRKHFPQIALMVDANSAYTLADVEHLKQLDAFSLMMIEQPFAYNDLIDHSELQKQVQTPICLDECIHSSEDARKAIQIGSGKIINVKIGRVGGIQEAIKLHNVCQESGVDVWCGGMLESGIGRAHNIAISSLAGFTLPGDTAASANYWEEDIIEPEVVVHDGLIRIPEKPGIGYAPVVKRIQERTEYEQSFLF
ncbi:o-succinylbenzoate synthase [Paenibacillus eucommiae]|uniref:o-succinylbenzoate synthase n=1 Tax=Paenibacillus eucommiae TaxID=1355755 RepID=A0ABS4J1U4_9BACL|nr:o-succinylbenzoate synthase [Paenibacillus eucommiae]MBP1993797.1 O-succinylbenzoate synthase [Paenibacillus eucommiae]